MKCKMINVSAAWQKTLSTKSILSYLTGYNFLFSLHIEMVGLHNSYRFNAKRRGERVEGEDEWEREEEGGRREGGKGKGVVLS